jgi:hypothetical protein
VNIIGTKWIFKNKQEDDGEIVRNKTHLVAQGFSQVQGLDFGETFALVPHLEAIRILLAFAASKGFKLYQMDVKSALLNGVIQEEVYVMQPLGFENLKYSDRVYKISKVLYGLKQASRAWYARLKTFLLKHGYVMGRFAILGGMHQYNLNVFILYMISQEVVSSLNMSHLFVKDWIFLATEMALMLSHIRNSLKNHSKVSHGVHYPKNL